MPTRIMPVRLSLRPYVQAGLSFSPVSASNLKTKRGVENRNVQNGITVFSISWYYVLCTCAVMNAHMVCYHAIEALQILNM